MRLLARIQQIDKALSKLASTANSINPPSKSESSLTTLTTMSKSDLRRFVINEIIPIIKSQMRFQR